MGQLKPLLLISGFVLPLFCFATPEDEAERAALEMARKTTNTDNNGDGQSDANAVTFANDAKEQVLFNTHVAGANLRGSLADLQCISATGEACATESYFLGGNSDLNARQISQNIEVLANNTAAGLAAGENAFQKGAAGLCSNVPTAFGCMAGDLELLETGRAAAFDAIQSNVAFLPQGKSATEFLAGLDSLKENLLAAQKVMDAPPVVVASLMATQMPDKNTDPLRSAFTYEDYARGDPTLRQKATFGKDKWVGPEFLKEMSAGIEIANSLSVVDPNSGKELSLFQRATRRYQNFDLSRARTLAQSESIREGVSKKTRAPANHMGAQAN